MSARRFAVGVLLGVGLCVVGLLLPRYGAPVVPRDALALFAFAVAGVGVPAVFLHRMATGVESPELPAPELPAPTEVPGAAFDGLLDDAGLDRNDEPTYALERLHDRLREVARATLVARERLSPAAATARLDRGSWTDDALVATFLRDGPAAVASPRGMVGKLRSGSDPARDAVKRTVAALVRTSGQAPSSAGRSSVGERARAWLRGGRAEPAPLGYTVTSAESTVRATRRWHGISAVALVGIGVGLLAESAAILLVGAVGVGYAAYARTRYLPEIDLSAARTLSDESPAPGDEVAVTLTLANEGERALPDVRLLDGVPEAVGVGEGTPRGATPLPAGAETTLSYTVRARRGRHEFGPVRVLVRDLAETVEHDCTVAADGEFTCRPEPTPADEQPLRRAATGFVGQLPTTDGGAGLEFHSTREYRRGDPLARVDWKRFARTGNFSTVAFREERATSVVLVVDARTHAYAAPAADAPPACDHAANAAVRLAVRLRRDGHSVGLAALAPAACWIPPGTSRATEARLRDALATHPAFGAVPPAEPCYTTDWVEQFRRRISHPAQVVLLSPVCDAGAVRAARSLDGYGYPATVVAPDPTTFDTPGRQLAALERQARLDELRRAGVRVVDWDTDRPLDVALLRASERWSR